MAFLPAIIVGAQNATGFRGDHAASFRHDCRAKVFHVAADELELSGGLEQREQ
jgi:hypothetical protein